MSWNNFDPWQVVPRQVFIPYSHLLISTALVVVSCVGCLGVTGLKINMISVNHFRADTRFGAPW